MNINFFDYIKVACIGLDRMVTKYIKASLHLGFECVMLRLFIRGMTDGA